MDTSPECEALGYSLSEFFLPDCLDVSFRTQSPLPWNLFFENVSLKKQFTNTIGIRTNGETNLIVELLCKRVTQQNKKKT